mgnify:CR=1 FL=1
MPFSRVNTSAATLTNNRTEESIVPASGMCVTFVDGCVWRAMTDDATCNPVRWIDEDVPEDGHVGATELAVRAANPRAERQLTGWLDLAWVVRNHLVEPAGVEDAVGAWKQRHPYHVLNESQALDTWLRYRQGFKPPRRIAVILPAAGRLQAAGEAIRDGFLSAFTASPGRSELLFFPTDDDPQSPIDAYFSALDAGADWIVGPLRQESVAAILELARGARGPDTHGYRSDLLRLVSLAESIDRQMRKEKAPQDPTTEG